MSKRTYITFGNDGSAVEQKIIRPVVEAAEAAAASGSQIVYRLGRIAEEMKGASAPNATTAAGVGDYTDATATDEDIALEDVVSADGAADNDKPRALVMVRGKDARTVLQSAAAAGLKTYAPYTKDHKSMSHLRIAHDTVCLGDKYSDELFCNGYAVLKAAEACGASIILLADESLALAEVDAFLAHANEQEILVFKALSPESPDLGWTQCTTTKQLTEENNWVTCRSCGLTFDGESFAQSYYTCPSCGAYGRETSIQRIRDLLDIGSFIEWQVDVDETDPLDFPGYLEKIEGLREKTGLDEAVKIGRGCIAGIPTAFGVMDSTFMMGSMGSVVGAKVSGLFDRATEEGLPVVLFCASGGARMQEGLVSLMQMAKVSCAVERHGQARLPYISVITDPTTGGVTASFATQGDIILAEPRALLGFAGKRVIQDTIRQELPEGFQTAEFALEHGLIDAVVKRSEMRPTIAHILAMHAATRPEAGKALGSTFITYESVCDNLESGANTYNHIKHGRMPIREYEAAKKGGLRDSLLDAISSQEKVAKYTERFWRKGAPDADVGFTMASGSDAPGASPKADERAAWDSVQLARNTHRPTAQYYIERVFDGFIELHGDRAFGDDGAIMAGLAWIGNQAVTVIAEEKGADLKDRVKRNFGCPQPEGYRKSLRLMRQAEKFGRPIVCLVDTQGAFCGAEAEARGQGNAIADNLVAMAGLTVPVVSILLGEGGSGGALSLAVSNIVGMQEYSVYSVLSPEGFASILWKDRSRAAEAASAMRMDAASVFEMGVVDEVVSEGPAPAHENPEAAAENVRAFLVGALDELCGMSADELIAQRHERFARF